MEDFWRLNPPGSTGRGWPKGRYPDITRKMTDEDVGKTFMVLLHFGAGAVPRDERLIGTVTQAVFKRYREGDTWTDATGREFIAGYEADAIDTLSDPPQMTGKPVYHSGGFAPPVNLPIPGAPAGYTFTPTTHP